VLGGDVEHVMRCGGKTDPGKSPADAEAEEAIVNWLGRLFAQVTVDLDLYGGVDRLREQACWTDTRARRTT